MTDNHKNIKKQLFHYILDSLPPKRRRKVETHLEACETCRREKESMESLMNGVKSKTGFTLPDYAFERAKTEMKKEYQKQFGPQAQGKETFIRSLMEKINSRRSLRWIFQPAALIMMSVLVSLIILGVSLLTQPNQLMALNFPFSLFRAFAVS